jgi:hypothetical protein
MLSSSALARAGSPADCQSTDIGKHHRRKRTEEPDCSLLLEFLLPRHTTGVGEIAIQREEDVLDLGIDCVVKAPDWVGA